MLLPLRGELPPTRMSPSQRKASVHVKSPVTMRIPLPIAGQVYPVRSSPCTTGQLLNWVAVGQAGST